MQSPVVGGGDSASVTLGLVATLACFCLLLSRVMFLGPPMVFADEYAYAAWAYWVGHREALPTQLAPIVHNWLFSLIGSVAHMGQGHLIEKIRLINVVATTAAMIPFYRIASQVFTSRWSLLIGVVFAWGAGGYVAFFMPDAIFTVVYIALLATVFTYLRKPTLVSVLWVGLVHGLLIAVKPHGVFLLPVFVVLIAAYDTAQRRIHPSKRGLIAAVGYALITVAVYATIDSLVWGELVLNPFGGYYSGLSTSWTQRLSDPQFLINCFRVLIRHLAFVAAVASLPMLVTIVTALRTPWRAGQRDDSPLAWIRPAGLFVLLSYLCLLSVAVMFSVTVAGAGPLENLDRVHGRYYDFTLVVLFFYSIVAAAAQWQDWTPRLRWGIAFAALACTMAGYWMLLRIGAQGHVDFVLGLSAYNVPKIRLLSIALALATLAVLVFRPRHTAKAMFASLAIYMALNAWFVDKIRKDAAAPTVIDRFGQAMDLHVGTPQHQYVIFKTLDPDAYRAAFYMIGDGTILPIATDKPVDCGLIKPPASVIALHGIALSCDLSVDGHDAAVTLLSTPEAGAGKQ